MGDPGEPQVRRDPVSRSGRWAVGTLIGLALVAWAITIRWGMQMGSMRTHAQPMGAVIFLVMWGVMQAAMMFPSVLFMATAFANISERQGEHHRLRTVAFLFGYLATWILTGVAAYPIWRGLQAAMAPNPDSARWTGAAILVVAGLYQLSPLKYRCLSHCRSPLSFFIQHPVGRSPLDGIRLGLYHGAYCVGCCWALMAVLFAVGLMNLAWMGLLTIAIFVEKAYRQGHRVGQLIGVALIALGILLLGGPPWIQQSLFGQ
ncbi:MAG: DUF2182 domain-containing protein [Actinomycetota bacterium]